MYCEMLRCVKGNVFLVHFPVCQALYWALSAKHTLGKAPFCSLIQGRQVWGESVSPVLRAGSKATRPSGTRLVGHPQAQQQLWPLLPSTSRHSTEDGTCHDELW